MEINNGTNTERRMAEYRKPNITVVTVMPNIIMNASDISDDMNALPGNPGARRVRHYYIEDDYFFEDCENDEESEI